LRSGFFSFSQHTLIIQHKFIVFMALIRFLG
jgi:hypothetical protein